MKAPHAVSYQDLLAYTEDRLFLDKTDEDFVYLAELVDDLYTRIQETEFATYSGSLRPGKAYRESLGHNYSEQGS